MRRKCLSFIIAVLLLCGIAQADWRFNPYTQKLDYTVYSRATATGDIIYHTGVVWNALNIGAAGTVLTVAGGVPTWAGGGGVLPISTVQFSILVADAVGGWTEDALFRVNAGNVVAGTWTSTRIAPLYGGTGINTSLATGVPFIVAGAWGTNAVVTVAYGGTGAANLTNHGVVLGSGAAAVTVTATGTAGQPLLSGGAAADPNWGTLGATYGGTGANSAAWTGVPSVAAGAWAINAQLPVTLGGTGVATLLDHGIMLGSGAAAVTVSAVGAGGQLFQSLGAGLDPVWTTSTWPATTTINQLLYSIAANSVVGLATANSGLLVTSAGGVPSIATDIPTAVTIGGAYVYRVGGTDVAVADGGTGLGVWVTGDIVYASGAGVLAGLADVAVGSVIVSGGVGIAPAWSTDIAAAVTIGGAYIYRVGGTDVAAADGGTGLGVYVVGDLLYASAVNALSRLADVAVGAALMSGGVGVAPIWDASPSFTGLVSSVGLTTTGQINVSTTDLNGIVFGSLGTATRAIDLSATGLTGNDYLLYIDAYNYWQADGDMRVDGALYFGEADNNDDVYCRMLYVSSTSHFRFETVTLSQAKGTLEFIMNEAGSNIVMGLTDNGTSLLAGNYVRVAGLTAVTVNGSDLEHADIDTNTAVGDLVHIKSGTGVTVEFYRITAVGANAVTVDRAPGGNGSNIVLEVYKDVIFFGATDGVNGQRMMNYSHQDKPLQIGGDTLQAAGAALGSEDVLFGNLVQSLDDNPYYFGSGVDAAIEYDEDGDDTWQFSLPAGGMSLRTTQADTDNAGLIRVEKVTKAHGDDLFDAAALTDSANIWAQPAGSVMLSAKYVLDAQFVAVGMTDLDVTLGLAGDNTGVLNPAAHNLISDAVGTEYTTRGAYWSATTAAGYHSAGVTTWVGYATAVGANLSTTSAGSITFYFMYIDFPGT